MSAKKWIVMFCAAVVLALALIAGFNMLADPFGVFGDPLFHWDAYSETNNPRLAKPMYLEAHPEEYDSFLIGSSSAASYPVEELNRYLDASFYNLFVYGSDTNDYRQLAEYVVREFSPKHIVLNLGVNETNLWQEDHSSLNDRMHCHVTGESPWSFYPRFALCNPRYSFEKLQSLSRDTELPQAFDVFRAETGAYDKRVRDVEKIGDPAAYEAAYGASFGPCESPMTYWRECIESVAAIRDLCERSGVELTVVCSPVYESQWQACPPETMAAFKQELARVTPYWDFSHTSLSYDSRFFYDKTHLRNALGSMVLGRMFGNDQMYLPDDFGVYVTEDNAAEAVQTLFDAQSCPEEYTRTVPVLMYHHFEPEGNNSAILTAASFERHMHLLAEAGFHAVTPAEMADYVLRGTPLPENPVCITMDDGYLSNYEVAFPVLRETGLKATIFPIGVSVGKTTYKDTDIPIIPHFSWEQAAEMQASGVIDIQSHTYDMHQVQAVETQNPCRSCACPLEGESEADFIAAMTADLERFRSGYEAHGFGPLTALAYPTGRYTALTEILVHESGIPVTFSTATDRPNVLVQGLPQSLYALCRLNVTDSVTDQQLLDFVSGNWTYAN